MADSKVSALTSYTTPTTTDVVPIIDVTNGATKKILLTDLPLKGSQATTFTFNGTGSPGTSSSVTLRYQRIGDWVTLYFPVITATSGTTSFSLTQNTAIADTWARPATVNQTFVIANFENNGASQTTPGWGQISTSGIVTFSRDANGTAFANGTTCGLNVPATVTYYVGTGS